MAGLAPYLQLLTLAGVQINYGTGTLTWTGAQNSPVLNVAHGLGRVPLAVLLCLIDGTELAAIQQWGAADATNFHALGWVASGVLANGTQRSFHWIAIG